MAVDPFDIIEKQLTLLKAQSDISALTYDETKNLETLVKLSLILKLKAARDSKNYDPLDQMSADELKALLPLVEPSDG